jgi:hypothetical protein
MTTGTSTTFADPSVSTTEYGSSDAEQHPLVEAGHQAGQSVSALAERATGMGYQQADRAREQAARGLDHVSSTIRRVSMDMEADQPALANAATTVADQAERIGEYLRTTDARQIVSNVENAARRQPLIFLGGAFVLGVAAARLIKAAGGSSNAGTGQQRQGQPWSSGIDYHATGPGATHSGMGTSEGI